MQLLAVQPELELAGARSRRAGRPPAPRCRGPRRSPCRRRTASAGSRPRSRRSRADGPRRAPPCACRPDRGSGPSAPPSSSACRRARGGSRSAGASRRASGSRSESAPRLDALAALRLAGDREVALVEVRLQGACFIASPPPGSTGSGERASALHQAPGSRPAARARDSRAGRAARASASPARACSATPQTAACSSGAPRAASPAMMPASTSPEPEVARPTLPPSWRQARPSGVAMTVRRALQRDDGVPAPRRVARVRAPGRRRWLPSPAPVRCAISPACGVSERAAARSARGRPSAPTSIASASSTTRGVARVRQQRARERAQVAASSCMPGPIEHARRTCRAAPRARPIASAREAARRRPRRSAMTRASGIAQRERRRRRSRRSRSSACRRRRAAPRCAASMPRPASRRCRRRRARGRALPCRRRRRAAAAASRAAGASIDVDGRADARWPSRLRRRRHVGLGGDRRAGFAQRRDEVLELRGPACRAGRRAGRRRTR